MSFGRASQQWATFSKVWYLLNAYKQPPGKIASIAAHYLQGKHKPIYSPQSQVGDHVVIVNSNDISYSGNKWEQKTFYSHTGRPRGKLMMQAYKVHEMDPTWIVRRLTYRNLSKVPNERPSLFCCLHVFPDEDVPEEIMENISSVIPSPRRIPKAVTDYSQEEIDNFTRVWVPASDFAWR